MEYNQKAYLHNWASAITKKGFDVLKLLKQYNNEEEYQCILNPFQMRGEAFKRTKKMMDNLSSCVIITWDSKINK